MINQSIKFFHGRFDLHTFQFSERQHPASFIPEFPLYEFGPQVKETCDALYDHLLKKLALGKLVTEKPVNFVGFDNVVEFKKNRQNDDNVVKAYKS